MRIIQFPSNQRVDDPNLDHKLEAERVRLSSLLGRPVSADEVKTILMSLLTTALAQTLEVDSNLRDDLSRGSVDSLSIHPNGLADDPIEG